MPALIELCLQSFKATRSRVLDALRWSKGLETLTRSHVLDAHVLAPGDQRQPGDVLHRVVAPLAVAVLVLEAGGV